MKYTIQKMLLYISYNSFIVTKVTNYLLKNEIKVVELDSSEMRWTHDNSQVT